MISARVAGESLADVLADITMRTSQVELVTDADAAAAPATVEDWLRHAERPGTPPDVLRVAAAHEIELMIELGAGDASPPVTGAAGDRALPQYVPSVSPPAEVRGLLESAGRVWAAGVDLDWSRVNGPRPARTPELPSYPFQRRTYWPDQPRPSTSLRASGAGDGVGLRPRIVHTATGETIGESQVSLRQVPFLAEHRVHGRLVVPGVLFLELVLRTADHVFESPAQAQDLVVSRSLVLGDDDATDIQVVIDRPVAGKARARVFSRGSGDEWHEHFATVLHSGQPVEPPAGAVDDATFAAERARCDTVMDAADFYGQAWHPLFRLGPSFTLVQSARRGPRAAIGTLVQPAPDAVGVTTGIRPELLLLDACIQLVSVAALSAAGFEDRPVHLGTGYERMIVGSVDEYDELECLAVLRDSPDGAIVGDLRLFAPDGRLVAKIWGAGFRPVTAQMLSRIIAGSGPAGAAARRPAHVAPDVAVLHALGEAERHEVLLDHLVRELAVILGCEPGEVERDLPIVDLADSLMIAELRDGVSHGLAVTVPMDVFFDGTTLGGLTRWVLDELAGTATEPVPQQVVPDPGTAQPDGSRPDSEVSPGPVVSAPVVPAPVAAPVRPARAPGRRSRLTAMSVDEMTALAELEPAITATGTPESASTAPRATFLTGATGFVGAFLLDELLKRRDGDVFCLVRASDTEHARRRLLDNLRFYGIDPEPHERRIVPVVGDLAAPQLGLGDGEFAALHARIGDMLHCGGMVKWTYPYRGLEGPNVAGTREVLRLATLGRPRPVHFISTVGVFSSKDYPGAVVTEDEDMRNSGSLVVGYAQTKWVSERMVRFAHERGVPVTIHRINTGGHSVTGAFNRLDHLTMILKGCIETGIAPDDLVEMPLQPAPIDYVASAVVAVSTRPELAGGTFHLANERAMDWKQLFDSVEEFGYPLERVTRDEWRDRVTGRNAGTMALLGLAPFLHDALDHVRLPLFDTSRTRSLLEGLGVSCPPLTPGLVHTFLRGFTAAGHLDAPSV